MASERESAGVRRRPGGWAVVAEQELRDLWLTGRALGLLLAFSVLLSGVAYLAATNQSLNYLEQREAVDLAVQVALAVGALLVLLAAASAYSGERERGSLESLLLAPTPRVGIATGKLLAPLALWLAVFVVTIPYVWFLGRGVAVTAEALGAMALVGSMSALALGGLGILLSALVRSSRVSIAIGLVLLLGLLAPTQLPTGARRGSFGDALLRIDPLTAAAHYASGIVVRGHAWTDEAAWLAGPAIAAIVLVALGLAAGRAVRLDGGLGR